MDSAEGGDLGRELFSKFERDRSATEGKAIKRLHEERARVVDGWKRVSARASEKKIKYEKKSRRKRERKGQGIVEYRRKKLEKGEGEAIERNHFFFF